MNYVCNRIFSKNRLEYFVIISGNREIAFYISKSSIFYDWNPDLKGCFEITLKDSPEWLVAKIDFLLTKSTEQAEIKFNYVENGFWKSGVEYITFNFIKGDEGFHEEAIQIFKERFSEKYYKYEIISVSFC